MTYETHKFGITSTSDRQLFEFVHLDGRVIGKVVYNWGRRPVSQSQYIGDPDLDYVVRQVRSE